MFILLYYTFSDYNNSDLNIILFILFICVLFSTLGIYMSKFAKAYRTTINELAIKELSIAQNCC